MESAQFLFVHPDLCLQFVDWVSIQDCWGEWSHYMCTYKCWGRGKD